MLIWSMLQGGGADGEKQGPTLESGGSPPPPFNFCPDGNSFYMRTPQHSKPKVTSRYRHAANYKFDIAFGLFIIFLYVIARKVRKCPLSPIVARNVSFVVSCTNGRQPVCFTISWRTLQNTQGKKWLIFGHDCVTIFA